VTASLYRTRSATSSQCKSAWRIRDSPRSYCHRTLAVSWCTSTTVCIDWRWDEKERSLRAPFYSGSSKTSDIYVPVSPKFIRASRHVSDVFVTATWHVEMVRCVGD